MNLLYCIPHLYHPGGMERVLTQKVNWLASHTNHKITILTTESAPDGIPPVNFPMDTRIEVVHLSIDFDADYDKPLIAKWIGHMRRMRIYRRALTEYIRSHSIDLCISLCGKEVAFLRHLPCRTMAEMHFAKDHRQQWLEAAHKGRIWSLLGRIRTQQLVHDVRDLERVIVLTEKDRADWCQAGCQNIRVIPNPCSLDSLEIPISSEKSKTILAVGRLHAQKGFDRLLQAWSTIETNHPDWSLRIVGEGPERAALEQTIQQLGLQRALLAGATPNIAEEYARASLFVLSSRYEGMPLALIEAMWSGVPCIAFDCKHGPAELLDETRGWLVSNGDISALSRQISYAITHPNEAQERAAAACTYAQQRFSEATVMKQWTALFRHRICYINTSLNTGSTGHIVEQLGREAQEAGYECVVAHGARYTHESSLPHYAFSTRLEEYMHGLLSLLGNAHGLGSYFATRRLIRFLDHYRPNLIHLHNIHGYYLYYPLLFSYLQRASIPVVWTQHDCWALTGRCAHFASSDCTQWEDQCIRCPRYDDYPRSLIKASVTRNYRLKKQVFSGIEKMEIISVSRWMDENVSRSLLRSYPHRVIYNGIDTTLFRPTESSWAQEHGWADKTIILGVASPWTEEKGWSDWLRLANALDDRFRIVVVGVNQTQQRLLPPHCLGIPRTDNREEIVRIYSAADWYVHLAHQESFGLTILEAMACGTPCIAYRTTAIPEITTEKTCTLVTDGDVQTVAHTLQQEGKTRKQAVSALCREHVVTHFNEQDTLTRYMRLYADLI